MASCWVVRRNLTAWIDGELPQRKGQRIQRHLAACTACAAEAESLRAAIRWQRRALSRITMVTELDCAPLRVRMQRALAGEPEQAAPAWAWIFRPFFVAGAAATLAIVVAFSIIGGPKAVLIPLGVESPPVAVTSEPELFENYQLLQHLDALENFDTVDSVPLDDDQTLHRG